MNAGGRAGSGKNRRHGAGKCDAGVGDTNQNFLRRGEALVRNDGGGGALFGASEVVFVFGKGEVAGLGTVGGGEAFEHGLRVTDHLPFKCFAISAAVNDILLFGRLAVDLLSRPTITMAGSSSTLVCMAKTLRVGLIGYRFMGRAHSNAWRQAPRFFGLKANVELHTICGRKHGRRAGRARPARLAACRDRLARNRRVAAD